MPNLKILELLISPFPKMILIISEDQFPKDQFTFQRSTISEEQLKLNLRPIIRHFSFHKTNNNSGILKMSWFINDFHHTAALFSHILYPEGFEVKFKIHVVQTIANFKKYTKRY